MSNPRPREMVCTCIRDTHHPLAVVVPDEECGRHGINKEK